MTDNEDKNLIGSESEEEDFHPEPAIDSDNEDVEERSNLGSVKEDENGVAASDPNKVDTAPAVVDTAYAADHDVTSEKAEDIEDGEKEPVNAEKPESIERDNADKKSDRDEDEGLNEVEGEEEDGEEDENEEEDEEDEDEEEEDEDEEVTVCEPK